MINRITNIKFHGEYHYPCIREDGIYVPVVYSDEIYDQRIITKEMFVEAYNKWINNNTYVNASSDDADCWCE